MLTIPISPPFYSSRRPLRLAHHLARADVRHDDGFGSDPGGQYQLPKCFAPAVQKLGVWFWPLACFHLGADGSISRMGSGAVDNSDHALCIGRTDSAVFRRVNEQISPELLDWCGQSLIAPEIHGQICQLKVMFQQTEGRGLGAGWEYGSESMGPPPVVCDFVIRAVAATNPWFTEQQTMTKGTG